MSGTCGGTAPKGCGSCQLCCPSMRAVCGMPSCYTSCPPCGSPCCMPCCPPSGFGCKGCGPCPTSCCGGARCSQVTCCPEPTIVPIQIWGCTPHGCCKTQDPFETTKFGGGGFSCK